jgi:hypothetical protein
MTAHAEGVNKPHDGLCYTARASSWSNTPSGGQPTCLKRGDQALLGAQAATSEEGWGVAMAIFGHSALPDFMNKVGQFNIFNDLADHEVIIGGPS